MLWSLKRKVLLSINTILKVDNYRFENISQFYAQKFACLARPLYEIILNILPF